MFRTCMLLLCALPLISAAAPKAAFVYSSWSNATFKNEFDAHFKKLGWECDKYENTKLPELSDKLDGYDYVVAAAVANYEHVVDMKPYAAKWIDYLNKGGVLIVTDANYDSVLGKWVATFGANFACREQNCTALNNNDPKSKEKTYKDHPLMLTPQPLGDYLKTRYSHWAHIKDLAPQWNVLSTCVDGHALFAYQEVGRGMVVLCVASNLKNNPIGAAILENVADYQSMRTKGIKIIAFRRDIELENETKLADDLTLFGSPRDIERGAKACYLKLAVDKNRYDSFHAVLKNESMVKPERYTRRQMDVEIEEDGTVVVPLAYDQPFRGDILHTLTLISKGEEALKLSWQETKPFAIEIKLLRKHLYPGNKLDGTISLNLEKYGRKAFKGLEWRIDDGKWDSLKFSAKGIQMPIIDTAKLADGRHILQIRSNYDRDFINAMPNEDTARDWGFDEVEFYKHPEPKYRMRDDHVLLENGKPFFPLGFYHVSWSFTPEQRLEMVKDVASHGYNTVHVGILGTEKDNDSYGNFLDECAKLNIRVITEFGVAPEIVIPKYKNKPAVMGWNPGDEPAAAGHSPQEMFRRYDNFKKWDYNHLAYTVICIPAQYKNYASGTDVLAPDPYPVPGGPMDNIYNLFSSAKASANDCDTALWAVCQAFGGQKYAERGAWQRWPTGTEFRSMSYLALMAGAKGIIYYVYQDGEFAILKSGDLWEAAKDFPAEIADLTPFILNGQYEQLIARQGLYVGLWKLNGEQRLVAVNTGKDAVDVKVAFTGKTVVKGAPANLTANDGNVSFSVPPFDRVILK